MSDGPLPWSLARSRSYDEASPLAAQRRQLEQCAGTCLASPLVARSPLPAFDLSAMDGYAVAGHGPWELVGEVLAGSTWDRPLAAGTAVAVGTGARLPAGAHAVLQLEHASRRGARVEGEVAAGRHVRRAGEECAQGDLLLPAGTPVTGRVLGLAAASGSDELSVTPRPRVLALVTGDELLAHGPPRDGRVRDALGPQLPLLVAAAGGEVVGRSSLPDDRALLRAAVDAADADVVVTTGASSVGPADHLRPVLAELGAELLVDGVACRPGHPQLLARLPDGRFVVGLPGNPLAALVAAATVLEPLLAGLGGRPLRTCAGLLTEPVRASDRDTRLVPVRVEGLHAQPVPHTGSGMLRGAALADALAVVPPGVDLAAGAEVELLPLP